MVHMVLFPPLLIVILLIRTVGAIICYWVALGAYYTIQSGFEHSVARIESRYFCTCTIPVCSHSVIALHKWSINVSPVCFFFISIRRFSTNVRHSSFSTCCCKVAYVLVILCRGKSGISWRTITFAIATSWSIRTIARESLCHNIDAAALSSSHFSFNWICYNSAACACSLTRWWNKSLVMLTLWCLASLDNKVALRLLVDFPLLVLGNHLLADLLQYSTVLQWIIRRWHYYPDDLSPMCIPIDPVLSTSLQSICSVTSYSPLLVKPMYRYFQIK